jgi:hypothetical protein
MKLFIDSEYYIQAKNDGRFDYRDQLSILNFSDF